MQLQNNYQAFQNAGAEIVALAVSSVSAVNSARQTTGATYPMLADAQHQVAEAYGIYNLLGDKLAAPAVFVIDTDGRITWHHVGQNTNDRPSVRTILEQLPQQR
ncbi:MAG TPA: redoxin domain-containing protein [Chloroflexi bacterium]|nr:redoxin domain-containing protein [Chloroflexota bacterium]